MDKTPKMVIGLGNPDPEYKDTYHNIGRELLEYLKEDKDSTSWKDSSKDFLYLKNNGIFFLKPKTYMNESGKAVRAALLYTKIKPENLLVIHDDSDIALGEYKYSFGRNSAGHRGVESIMKTLKTKDFWRLRIGIRSARGGSASGGKKSIRRVKASDLVLKKIGKADKEIFKKVFKEIKKSEWSN